MCVDAYSKSVFGAQKAAVKVTKIKLFKWIALSSFWLSGDGDLEIWFPLISSTNMTKIKHTSLKCRKGKQMSKPLLAKIKILLQIINNQPKKTKKHDQPGDIRRDNDTIKKTGKSDE